MKRRKRIEGEDNSSGASSAARQIPTSPCFRSEKGVFLRVPFGICLAAELAPELLQMRQNS